MKLCDVEFGDKAMNFYEEVIDFVDKEHLLVFYSTGLLSKVILARRPNDRYPIADEEVEIIYAYFEDFIPLSGKFNRYAKDDSLFKSSIASGRLSQMR